MIYWGREQAQGLKCNFVIRRTPRSHGCIYMHHHNGLISDHGTDLQSKALIALTFEHVRAFTICAYHLSNILIVSVLIVMFVLLRSICMYCECRVHLLMKLCVVSIPWECDCWVVYSVHTDRDRGFFLHVFVVVINCTCQVVTCIVQLCAVFILILIGGQRDKGVSPAPYFISYGCK